MRNNQPISQREYPFPAGATLVSVTDLKGRIVYCNPAFLEVSGFSREELMGQSHNIVRHPDMPHCVFKLLWDTITQGKEIFAYVLNMAKNGDHYWVIAHVTPNYDSVGGISGFHSSRRTPDRNKVEIVKNLYATLLAEEKKYDSPKDGMAASFKIVADLLEKKGMEYDQFILTL